MAQRMQDAQDAQMNLAQLASANLAAAHDQTSPAALQARYVQSHASECPFCQSSEVEGGPFDVEDGVALQEMTCCSCDKFWCSKYQLTGFTQDA